MEDLVSFAGIARFYSRRRVLVTGHTGFKGAWLSFWLAELGAQVSGFALPPQQESLFCDLRLDRRLDWHQLGDIRDANAVREAVQSSRPEIIFHLAAQPLVRRSYAEPRLTYETNVLGVVNVLEAVRLADGPRVVQVITTDKCYENTGRGLAFRESDPLGGSDPYSSSKACAEFVVAAYRHSFHRESLSLATARAGNVIGGGDWSEDRIIPDCVRAFSSGSAVLLRNPHAIRPWQFVLEPLAGYLLLACRQWHEPQGFAEAWNFGPSPHSHLSVGALVEIAAGAWGEGTKVAVATGTAPPQREASTLVLDASKAVKRLGWQPRLDVHEAVAATMHWYRQRHREGDRFDAETLCRQQIATYIERPPAKSEAHPNVE